MGSRPVVTECEWAPPVDGWLQCQHCGNRMRWVGEGVQHRARCRRKGPPPADVYNAPTACAHNLGAYDDYEAHALCGCQSNEYVAFTMVCECELHGDVTPLAKITREGLRSCIGCADYQS